MKQISLILVLSGLTQICALKAVYDDLDKQIWILGKIGEKEKTLWKEVESKETALVIQDNIKAIAVLYHSYATSYDERTKQHCKEAEQEWIVRCQAVQQRMATMRVKELRNNL